MAEIVDKALRFHRNDGRFAYIAPFKHQAVEVAWDYLKAFTKHIPGTVVNETKNTITLFNGSRIRVCGADNPDSIRGAYLDGVVMDEVADMKPNLWSAVVYPMLCDQGRNGWAIFIGTPKGLDVFHDLYQRALSGEEDWWGKVYRASETGIVDPKDLERARLQSESDYMREYECDFDTSTDSVLIRIQDVMDSIALHKTEHDMAGFERVMGVDVATGRPSGDRSVIAQRWGSFAYPIKSWQTLDNMALASTVSYMAKSFKPDAIFIDAGRGEGVISRLRQLNVDVIPVEFGGKPDSPIYANKRAEMWFNLAESVRNGLKLPDDNQVKSDLTAPHYKHNPGNKLILESKEDIKKRIGRSPDYGDALALTYAYPVVPQELSAKLGLSKAQGDFNPFL